MNIKPSIPSFLLAICFLVLLSKMPKHAFRKFNLYLPVHSTHSLKQIPVDARLILILPRPVSTVLQP